VVEQVVMVPVPAEDGPALATVLPSASDPSAPSRVVEAAPTGGWAGWPFLFGPLERTRPKGLDLHDLPELRPVELARSPDSGNGPSTAADLLSAEIRKLQSPDGETL
jgi:hypothetical protein